MVQPSRAPAAGHVSDHSLCVPGLAATPGSPVRPWMRPEEVIHLSIHSIVRDYKMTVMLAEKFGDGLIPG